MSSNINSNDREQQMSLSYTPAKAHLIWGKSPAIVYAVGSHSFFHFLLVQKGLRKSIANMISGLGPLISISIQPISSTALLLNK